MVAVGPTARLKRFFLGCTQLASRDEPAGGLGKLSKDGIQTSRCFFEDVALVGHGRVHSGGFEASAARAAHNLDNRQEPAGGIGGQRRCVLKYQLKQIVHRVLL